VYLDYNATTPLDPDVREAMRPFLGEVFGNPSSVHKEGRRARALLDDARERAAKVFACKPSEIVFTSGGTESVNLAILGSARALCHRGRHIITSAVEHSAVLRCCEYLACKEGFAVTYLPVDGEGRVHPESLAGAFRSDTILASIMAANNEIGTLQPVAELGALCRERGVLFHTDAVQWFGKEPLQDIHQFNADLVSICAHKFHGPKGAGALYIRSPFRPAPIILGGSHEEERRAGTENLAGIIGLTVALEHFVSPPVFTKEHLAPLTTRLISFLGKLSPLGVSFRGSLNERLANTVAFTVRGCDSISLLAALDLEDISASRGSACSTGSLKPSHVLLALGVARQEASSLVRFSLGRDSSSSDIEFLEKVLPHIIRRVQFCEQPLSSPANNAPIS
jgi:cysteine desulfurase